MISFTTPAFILRSVDVGQTDRLLTVFTHDRGKLSVVAKGLRKMESKLRSHAQATMLVELYLIAQRRLTLGGCVLLEAYPKLHQSLSSLWAAEHANDIIDQLVKPDHQDKTLFSLLSEYYRQVEDATAASFERRMYLTAGFDIQVLTHLGVVPPLSACVHCKRTDQLTRVGSNGFFCSACSRGKSTAPLQDSIRKLCTFAQQKPLKELLRVRVSLADARKAIAVSRILLEDHVTLPLASDAHLADVGRLHHI